MTTNDMIGVIITGLLSALLFAASIALLAGKGSFLIAGYNTASEEEQGKYNVDALCRYMGKILLPISIFMPVVAIGGIYEIRWIPIAYGLGVLALCIFSVIYCNTGGRFKK